MNKQRKEALSLVAILMAAAGLLAGGVLLQRRTELRRKAVYSNIDVSLQPQPLEVCQGETDKVLVKVDPSPKNAPETAEIHVAELSFNFDPGIARVNDVAFHEDYGASVWNGKEKANSEGKIKITAMTMGQTVPTSLFDIAEITFEGREKGEYSLSLNKDYEVRGERGETGADVDRELEINDVDQVNTQVKVVECEASYPDCLIDDMANDLGIDSNNIGVVENSDQEWSTGCLGCAESGEKCSEVITPGKKLVLESRESGVCWQYEYHTALDSDGNGSCDNYRLCDSQEIECDQTEWPSLSFQIKFGGTEYRVNDREIVVNDIPDQKVDVVVAGKGRRKIYQDVNVSFNDQAVGSGELELQGVVPGDDYLILVKGPVHLARRFCRDNQSEHCWLGQGGVTITEGENSFDWTGLELEPGDINRDGVVDVNDFTALKAAIGKSGTNVSEDLNRNGKVTGQDIVFFLETLSKRYEEEI